jgi:alpha-2-macroglobulin
VKRSFFKRESKGAGFVLTELADDTRLEPGDEVEVHLAVTARHPAEYVHVRDPRAAGCEPAGRFGAAVASGRSWVGRVSGLDYYQELHDSSTDFFIDQMPEGSVTLKYQLRVATAGTFRLGPAVVESVYAPEFVAHSKGAVLQIRQAE